MQKEKQKSMEENTMSNVLCFLYFFISIFYFSLFTFLEPFSTCSTYSCSFFSYIYKDEVGRRGNQKSSKMYNISDLDEMVCCRIG